jgi:hypothetical protein
MIVLFAVLLPQQAQQQLPLSAPAPSARETVQVVVQNQGGDDRYTRAPKPERQWIATPDVSYGGGGGVGIPTIATRGAPESYQSMGVIKASDGQLLPLYGRRTAARSDRFQYYTRTDTYNPVALPISYKNRDCQDDVGCDELMDGDTIRMASSGKDGHVTIYRFGGPTYVPFV